MCGDDVRWSIWDDDRIEPWYRQNLLFARRHPELAGKEHRIRAVIHPAMSEMFIKHAGALVFSEHVRQIEEARDASHLVFLRYGNGNLVEIAPSHLNSRCVIYVPLLCHLHANPWLQEVL